MNVRFLAFRRIAGICAALALMVAIPARPAQAFRFSDGTVGSCRDHNGRIVGETISPVPQYYTGLTRPTGDGRWTISWDAQKLSALGAAARDYLFFHECAHAKVPTADELQANCQGLIDMRSARRSSRAREAELARFHAALGYMGYQYGQGAILWQRTMQCAGGGTPGQAEMSTRCRFFSGPRAGQILDYAPRPPLRVGTPCTDGYMSAGVVAP
jgi:hypothetical protein